MAHHYHIVTKLDYSEHGGTKADHSYGAGLPLVWARDDAQELAKSINGFCKIAGGVWTDAPNADAFNNDLAGEYHYIYIDPCDNALDFDIPWNAYRDENHEFRRAPKGQPCPTLVKAEYKDRFFFEPNCPNRNLDRVEASDARSYKA